MHCLQPPRVAGTGTQQAEARPWGKEMTRTQACLSRSSRHMAVCVTGQAEQRAVQTESGARSFRWAQGWLQGQQACGRQGVAKPVGRKHAALLPA